jgi:hypothetical protein
MALFMVIHSLLIFPIWTRIVNGLPPASIGGIGLAGAFEQVACPTGWLMRGRLVKEERS